MGNQSDINEICGDIQANGKYLGSHNQRIKALLEHFAKAQIPLAVICDSRHMDKAKSTVKAYCREHAIALVDYVPMALRPPKVSK